MHAMDIIVLNQHMGRLDAERHSPMTGRKNPWTSGPRNQR